jgi:IS5 family transposase
MKGKVIRRERLLAETHAVIPWGQLLRLIEPHYPNAGNGMQPIPLEWMLASTSYRTGQPV